MGVRTLNSNTSSNTAITASLLTEEAFAYAHLVKFEKPLATQGGKSAERAEDYVYITDGSTDLVFDDGSSDVFGNTNNAQTYIANKLLTVGAISETIEARASNINLQISATALSTAFTANLTFTSSTVQIVSGDTNFVEGGFREGDLIELLSGSGSNDTLHVRVNTFSNNNFTANVTPISKIVTQDGRTFRKNSGITISSESNTIYSVNFNNPEVEGILTNRSQTSYARYINRDVFIYKVHIDVSTGQFIGAPYLLFKGIIATGKLTEDPSKSSIVSWGITSHWGDFQRVQGRLTSDGYHRALDGEGKPDIEAALRPAYITDLGFQHSEQALNLVSIYQAKETRYKEKRRGGLFNRLFNNKKTVEYQVEVDREVDLRFNLDAKYLPVVYGVNKIDSIPFFVDTLATDAKKVYAAYALCEGEVGGLYDVYFDDTSSVCIDKNDNDTRSSQTAEQTVDVLCYGRMDRGDTLTPNTVVGGSPQTAVQNSNGFGSGSWEKVRPEVLYQRYDYEPPLSTFPGGASTQASGITHEKGNFFSTPIDTRIIFHSGKSNQKADSLLLSKAGNFKVGNEYYTGGGDYWGANHRVLDTAYVVAEFTIGEGETTIPSLDFVVRGKGLDCYNYDYSYEQDQAYASADSALSVFNIGDTVTLRATSNNAVLGTIVIADIYSLTTMSGTSVSRVRFKSAPPIGTTKQFYMRDSGGSNNFHFVTYDFVGHSGTVPTKLEETITTASANSGGQSADIEISTPSTAMVKGLDFADFISFSLNGGESFDRGYISEFPFTYSGSGSSLTDIGSTSANVSALTTTTTKVAIRDSVALASSASSGNDAYNNYTIVIERRFADNTIKFQRRKIIDYDGATRVAKLDSPLDFIPEVGDTYSITFSSNNDNRVSTNPAIQLLDYLTNERYGRDLNLEKDIDLESFKEAARLCDTRSDVTMVTTTQPSVGTIYELKISGKRFWAGTVKSSTLISSGRYNTVFTDVVGKIVHRWESWKYFYTNELYYYKGALHQASSDGIISATPSTTSSVGTLNVFIINTATALLIETTSSRATFDGNPVVKIASSEGSSSGYSLYDSDDVKYWRYLGWEAQNQRFVTRHQTNAVINTANPVFANINSMLGQFNGILRYSNGKYSLAIKTAFTSPTQVTVDSTTYNIEDISDEDIIGSINIEDAGQKGTYNQVSVSINDPQNRFESRSIAMFNSNYLKEDRMVPKKGDIRTPSVSNYFNARINAKQYLDSSRSGLKVNFTMAPRGILLRAGDIIRITHSRFGWSNKLYRITNLSFKENCLVQVTANEHSDDDYLIQPNAPEAIKNVEAATANIAPPAAPVLATPVQNTRGGIELNWTNAATFNPATYTVQIWRSSSQDRSAAKVIGTSKSDVYVDSVIVSGKTTFYYWIRYAVNVPTQRSSGVAPKEIFSAYNPTSATGGKVGVSDGAQDAPVVNLTNDNVSIAVDPSGNVVSFANTGTTIVAFIGDTQLPYDAGPAPYDEPSFRVSNVSASTGLTLDSTPTIGSNSYALGVITGMSQQASTATYTIIVTDSLGRANTFERVQTFTKAVAGSKGEVGTKGEPGGPGDKGDKGGKGDVGAKGVTGDGGDKGDKGGKGDVGAKGVTGDGGDKGDKGGKGDVGAKGVTGDGGDKGEKGAVGDQGAKGVTGDGGQKGEKGAVGAQGSKGVTGDGGAKGATGSKGDTGAKGVLGDGGDKGAKGDTGPKGVTGVKGDPGEDVIIIYYAGLINDNLDNNATVGLNNSPTAPDMNGGSTAISGAFRITQADGTVTNWYTTSAGLNVFFIASAVVPSFTQAPRSEWTVSGFLQGDKGDKGDAGEKGVKGDQGQKGDTGQKGNTGDKGVKGDLGQKGAAGQKGDQGQKGGKGDLGQKGAAGQKGDQGQKGGKGDLGQKGTAGQKGDTGQKGVAGQKGDAGQKGGQGDKGQKGILGVKGADGSPGADAPYVVIGFSSSVDTNTERNNAIKSFSGLSVVKVNSVYWDAITGEIYQNRDSQVSNPTLTEISAVGTTAVVSDAISSNISATTTNQTTLSRTAAETLILGASLSSKGGRIYTFYRGTNSPTTSGRQHNVRVRIRQAASTTTIGSTSFGGSIEASQTLTGTGETHNFDIIDSFDSDVSSGTNRIIATGENTGTQNNASSTRFLSGRQLIVFELKR